MNEIDDIFNYLVDTIKLISTSTFGDKMILKGGSVLISKMIENDRSDMYRKTSDIDIHCDKKELWIDFYKNIESILNNNSLGYKYKMIHRRSEEKGLNTSDSLKFKLYDTNIDKEIEFKIDMNIKSNTIITYEYSQTLQMSTYDALTMLSDKIVVVSSQKIYRRIKDLYDLIVLVSLYNFEYDDILNHLGMKHQGAILENMLTNNNFKDINHAYSKYRGIQNKPDIMTVISIAQAFLQPIYNPDNVKHNITWDKEKSSWSEHC